MAGENTPTSKPLSESERKGLKKVSSDIGEAVQNNDPKTASYLRGQLRDAAEQGLISKEDAIDASLPPIKPRRRR